MVAVEEERVEVGTEGELHPAHQVARGTVVAEAGEVEETDEGVGR